MYRYARYMGLHRISVNHKGKGADTFGIFSYAVFGHITSCTVLFGGLLVLVGDGDVLY